MLKGLIETKDKAGYDLVKNRLFKQWDSYRGKNSLQTYLEAGRTVSAFLWDSFWATKTKIGDGVGMSGEVLWYALGHDDHIETALKNIWAIYSKQ